MSLGHINPHFQSAKKPQGNLSLFDQLRKGNVSALARAITLVESRQEEDSAFAKAILSKSLPFSGNSHRIGITGVPGVGKSTFIERLGMHFIKKGHKVAVLAIDPSSSRTHGSILGDKTRMEELVRHEHAFIRPSPAGDSLGGVARKTREAIILCEAAGYDRILVETVGVGQSETAVHNMTDFFLLLKLAGAGDDLQGIKKGIVEMADTIVINKADGDNVGRAREAMRAFQNALHLLSDSAERQVGVHTCSALKNTGISELANLMEESIANQQDSGRLATKRQQQDLQWLRDTIEQEVLSSFYRRPAVKKKLDELKTALLEKEVTPFQAAEQLLSLGA